MQKLLICATIMLIGLLVACNDSSVPKSSNNTSQQVKEPQKDLSYSVQTPSPSNINQPAEEQKQALSNSVSARSLNSINQLIEEGIADLYDLISAGTVSLVRAQGNGASSGNSVDAVLRNNSDQDIDVYVYMRRPLFLQNSGVGQNMIACMLLGADGGYLLKGTNSVVTLKPNQNFNSSMVAYCLDFEKDNPKTSESFAVNETPFHLLKVISRINDYVRSNPNADATAAAQVAVWLAQGVELGEIAKKYDFTSDDEALAYSFLQ